MSTCTPDSCQRIVRELNPAAIGQQERTRLRLDVARLLPDDPPHEVEPHAEPLAMPARQVDIDARLDHQSGQWTVAGRALGIGDHAARQAVSADELDARRYGHTVGETRVAQPADRVLGIQQRAAAERWTRVEAVPLADFVGLATAVVRPDSHDIRLGGAQRSTVQ